MFKIAAPFAGLAASYALYSYKVKCDREFALKNAPLAEGCPEIGQRVNKVVHGASQPYFVFGATGHSLATCHQIKERSEAKTHTYSKKRAYDSALFYVSIQSMIPMAQRYAKTNSMQESSNPESKIPAVAYLGVRGNVEVVDALLQRSSMSPEELNQPNPDIQVVYIDVLDNSSDSS